MCRRHNLKKPLGGLEEIGHFNHVICYILSTYLSYNYSYILTTFIQFSCNVGDPGLIAGSGRSPGEGIGYPCQYSWTSLMAQLVKNSPAMQEWVHSLGWEDPLEMGKATHSSILA